MTTIGSIDNITDISDNVLHLCRFTPLNILNGTPEGVPLDVSRATLPINQLKSTVIFDDCSNSNVHRCKPTKNTIREHGLDSSWSMTDKDLNPSPEGEDSSGKVTLAPCQTSPAYVPIKSPTKLVVEGFQPSDQTTNNQGELETLATEIPTVEDFGLCSTNSEGDRRSPDEFEKCMCDSDHEFIVDWIDIDPEKSQQIVYCKFCYLEGEFSKIDLEQ